FDEHGGTYDHVPPPWGAQNPDGLNGDETGFKFDLFGARVPTILVSPFVPPSTVFRAREEDIKNHKYPFDHTSFIKTLLSGRVYTIPKRPTSADACERRKPLRVCLPTIR